MGAEPKGAVVARTPSQLAQGIPDSYCAAVVVVQSIRDRKRDKSPLL